MKVRTDQIKDIPRELEFVEPAESFLILADMVSSGECRFKEPVGAKLSISREAGHFKVNGVVATVASLDCSRCLASFDYLVDSRFTMIFREGSQSFQEDEDEVELGEQDLVTVSFSGDEIDLMPEIGEQVALAMPLKPLCSDTCRGLCPVCGADMNDHNCGCGYEPVNMKFAALKDFKVRS